MCIARRQQTGAFEEEFFSWPGEINQLANHISAGVSANTYYCPHLFETPKRKKEAVSLTPCAWSDLDACRPENLHVEPTIVIESSPGRYQALWFFREPVEPAIAEDISKRIAYAHEKEGADKSGWDLTQLLRVPLTFNLKYTGQRAIVKILTSKPNYYSVEDFDVYPKLQSTITIKQALPESIPDPDEVLQKRRHELPPQAFVLYNTHPDKDWSSALWNLQMLAFESGLPREEVFAIARGASCNKYARDKKHEDHLWRETLRAEAKFQERQQLVLPYTEVPIGPLLSEEERQYVESHPSIVGRYIEWGKSVGDAAWQYHQAGALTILSGILAGSVRLPTNFGTFTPNMWFMILADTTLTRKTTAMDLAMDILTEIDAETYLATDGSVEGLLSQLQTRPGQPSVFLRDEVTGLVESMAKKDYLAGMMEHLCKLYDGKYLKRVLRKDTIEIKNPVLIFFAGGIRSKMMELLTYEHVSSGFLPRFCIIEAEGKVENMRPLGPPVESVTRGREALVEELRGIFEHYQSQQTVRMNGKTSITKRTWNAELTEDSWKLYNRFEKDLVKTAQDHRFRDLAVPLLTRLCQNGLKIASLLAAAREKQEGHVTVTTDDMLEAFYYVEQWRHHSLDVLTRMQTSQFEQRIETALYMIRSKPGVSRSQIMNWHHLSAKQMDQIVQTLEQRDQIVRMKRGRGETYTPVEAVV